MEKDIRNSLKGIDLRGFESLDLSMILYLPSEIYKYSNISFGHILKMLLNNTIGVNYGYSFEKKEGSKVLFAITHHFKRKDNFDLVLSLKDLNDRSDFIFYEQNKGFKIKLFNILKYFRIILKWYFQLRQTTLSFQQKLYVLSHLIDLYRLLKVYKKIEISKYNLLVVPYDANSSLNLLVQLFQRENVKTATLQHGIFLSPRNVKNIEYSGIEFKNFVSDYFLAWNYFTIDEALKSGIKKERLILAGIPQYIEKERPEKSYGGENFGVVLNTSNSHKQNIKLINIANDLSKQVGVKYKLKYHPRFKGTEYQEFVDNDFFNGVFRLDMGVNEYAKSVKFSLVSNSTVLMELAYLRHPVYILNYEESYDKYSALKFGKFESVDDIITIFNDKVEQNEICDYLCSISNPRKEYVLFLDKFIQS